MASFFAKPCASSSVKIARASCDQLCTLGFGGYGIPTARRRRSGLGALLVSSRCCGLADEEGDDEDEEEDDEALENAAERAGLFTTRETDGRRLVDSAACAIVVRVSCITCPRIRLSRDMESVDIG